MKAAYITETGPPSVIQFGEIPTPSISPTQALIRTEAVSVSPVDTYIRNGANYWELPQPFIIGCDVAGVVEEVGADVSQFRTGQRVWATNQGLMQRQGTFAEYCAIDQDWLYPTPDNVASESVAACALVGVTAHLGLVRDARLEPNEVVFVHGGSGGVGSMVVQMAKAMGARVIATAGSEEKVEAVKQLGADVVIHYKQQDVAEALADCCPDGVNVFWETLREPDFDFITNCLAERGRLVIMAGRDARPPFPVGPFYVKGCSLHGFVMFKATPDELRRCSIDISRWLSEGKLQPLIGKRMPLAEAAAAHQLQEDNTLAKAGTLAGKIILTP